MPNTVNPLSEPAIAHPRGATSRSLQLPRTATARRRKSGGAGHGAAGAFPEGAPERRRRLVRSGPAARERPVRGGAARGRLAETLRTGVAGPGGQDPPAGRTPMPSVSASANWTCISSARGGTGGCSIISARIPGWSTACAGMQFAVWAPNAQRVSVIGDFNSWDGRVHPMRSRIEGGIWEIFIPGVGVERALQVRDDRRATARSSTRAIRSPSSPSTGRRRRRSTWDYTRYRWSDDAWMSERARQDLYHGPMSIYEVHLGSWKRSEGKEGAC